MPGDIIKGGFKLEGTVDVKGAIDAKLQSRLEGITRAMIDLNRAQTLIGKGYNLNDYLQSELSSIENVTKAYKNYVKETTSGNAVEFLKRYNTFLGLGGDEETAIAQLGNNFTQVLNDIRKAVPADIGMAFSPENIRGLSNALSIMKEIGADVSEVMTTLSRPTNTALEENLAGAQWKISSLTRELREANSTIEMLGGSTHLDELNTQLENLKYQAMSTFDHFIEANGLNELQNNWEFRDYFENLRNEVEAGETSVGDAITRVRMNFSSFMQEASSGTAGVDPAALTELRSSLDEISARFDTLQSQITEMQSAMSTVSRLGTESGFATALAGELSADTEISEAARSAMANIITESAGLKNVADVLAQLVQNSTGASEGVDTVYASISNLVRAMADLSGAEGGKLESIAGALNAINGMRGLDVKGSAIDNIVDALHRIGNIPADKALALSTASAVDLHGFDNLSVKKPSLRNLAEFLPAISNVNPAGVSALKEIAAIDWTNLGNMKVSKASVANLASLVEIMDTVKEIQARVEAVENATGVMPVVGGATNASELEAEAAALEHATVAVEEYTVAEQNAANAVTEATPNIVAIEEEIAARENATSAAIEEQGAISALAEIEREFSALRNSGDIGGWPGDLEAEYRADYLEDRMAALRELDDLQRRVGEYMAQNGQSAQASEMYDRITAAIMQSKAALEEWVAEATASGRIDSDAEMVVAFLNELNGIAAAENAGAEAAGRRADAEQRVADAMSAETQSANAAEQTASAHDHAAEAAREQAAAVEQGANAEAGAAEAANARADAERRVAEEAANAARAQAGAGAGAAAPGAGDASQDGALATERQVERLLTQYLMLSQKHAELYAANRTDIDQYIDTLRNAGQITTEQYDQMAAALERYNREVRLSADAQTRAQKATTLSNRIQDWIGKNTSAYAAYNVQINQMMDELRQGGNISDEALARIASGFKNIEAAAKTAGINGQTFFQKLQAGWQKFAGWTLVTRSFTMVISTFKKMVSAVKEVDAAMTELRKVTDLTAVGYENLYQRAVNVATSIGASVSDTINATADFSRLGYDANEALQMAESALVYTHVGDFKFEVLLHSNVQVI